MTAETSKRAWSEIQPHLPNMQRKVAEAVMKAKYPPTASEIEKAFPELRGCWKRMSELRRKKIIVRTKTRRCRVTGKHAYTYWRHPDLVE